MVKSKFHAKGEAEGCPLSLVFSGRKVWFLTERSTPGLKLVAAFNRGGGFEPI